MNNVNNMTGKKKVAIILLALLAIVGIVLTLFLVQRQQELRSRAEKATVISLTPPSVESAPGQEVNLDVVVTPGTNQVGFVTLDINYDPNIFEVADDAFELDAAGTGFQIISSGQVVADGEYKVTVSAGSDPTNVIQNAAKKLGTLHLTVKSDAGVGTYEVKLDQAKTIATSISGTDEFNTSVLNNVVNSKIIIGGGVCKPNVATCSWDAAPGANTYHYKITNTKDDSVVKEGDIPTADDGAGVIVDFPSVPGETYKCEVVAGNQCGGSGSAEGTSTCPLPSATPTPGDTSTPTPSPKDTSTPTPTTPKDTATPTPTTPVGETSTPTPTKVTVVVTQPEQPGQPGAGKGGVGEVVNTPTPTIGETGNPVVYGGIIGGILFVVGGIALLFL